MTASERTLTGRAGPADHRAPESERRSWAVLLLLCVAEFMVILDVTVVNLALPSIGRGLHFAPADLQWVITAYVLLSGGFVLLGGRASDLIGRRAVFLAGLAVFTAASLASGLAPTAGLLIAARAAQGFGAALLTPSALSIITTTYSGRQRAGALSVWAAIGSGGAAAGLLIGGMLTTWLGWRSIFLVNVPVGVAAALISLRVVPRSGSRPTVRGSLDLRGALLVVAGLATGVYALAGAPSHGWGSLRTLVLLAVSVGLLAAFAVAERAAKQPLLPAQTWRNRSLVAGAAIMLGATAILIGTFFLNSLFLQNVQGASALRVGLEFLPLMVVIGVGAHLTSRLLPRFGSRALAGAGLALMAAGAVLLSLATAQSGYATGLLPGLLVIGAGIGLVFPAASVTAMSDVANDRAGLASGLMTGVHEIGAAIGVAVFSAVATTHLAGGFVAGYREGFVVAASIGAALAVLALLIVPAVRPEPGTPVAVH